MIVWALIFLHYSEILLKFDRDYILESELRVEVKLFCQNLCKERAGLSLMCLCSFSYSFLISFPFISLSLLSGFDWRRISDVSFQRQIVNNSVAVELCCSNFLVLANFLENLQPENDLIFWKQSCCISDHVSKLTWVDSVLNVQKVLCTRRQLQNRDETEIFLWDIFYFQCPFRGLCHIVNTLYKILVVSLSAMFLVELLRAELLKCSFSFKNLPYDENL